MDAVVVDSGVVIKWLIAEVHSASARRVLAAYQGGTLNLLAPDLIFAEVGNVVWKKQRFQGMSSADAKLVLDAFRLLTFDITTSTILLERAFELAVNHQRTVYDMIYLALSERNQCPLVTADEKLVNALGSVFPALTWVANWP